MDWDDSIKSLIVASPATPLDTPIVAYKHPYGVFDMELDSPFTGRFAITDHNLWRVVYKGPNNILYDKVVLAPAGWEGLQCLKREMNGFGQFVFAVSLKMLKYGLAVLKQNAFSANETLLQSVFPAWGPNRSHPYAVVFAHENQTLDVCVINALNIEMLHLKFAQIHPNTDILGIANTEDMQESVNVLQDVLNSQNISFIAADFDRTDEKPELWLIRQQDKEFNENYQFTRWAEHQQSLGHTVYDEDFVLPSQELKNI